jgi:hypothetical protein
MQAGLGTLPAGGEFEPHIRFTVDEVIGQANDPAFSHGESHCVGNNASQKLVGQYVRALWIASHLHDIKSVIVALNQN